VQAAQVEYLVLLVDQLVVILYFQVSLQPVVVVVDQKL
jgi:hypothetical protein